MGLNHGERMGFDHLFRHMLEAGCPPELYRHEGYWLDIGSPDDYKAAIETFVERKEFFLPVL